MKTILEKFVLTPKMVGMLIEEYRKEIFEQFIFIPKMLDTTSTKVQQCGFWSVISSAFIWLFDSATHFTVNMVGISILYAVLLFIVMIADFGTGITASKKEWLSQHPGEKWNSESKKGLRWAIKYITYIVGFYMINVLSKEIFAINFGSFAGVNIDEIFTLIFKVIKLFLMLYILRWELKSIDENLERLGYSFRIFDFFDNSITAVTSLFKSKTGIEIKDKEDK